MAHRFAVRTVILPFDDGQAIGESRDGVCLKFTFATSYTGVQHGAVIAGSFDDVFRSETVLGIESVNLCIRIQSFVGNFHIVGQYGHFGKVGEEFLHHRCAGEDARPSVGGSHAGHTGNAGGADQINGAAVVACFHAVLTDGQDDFLHGIGVFVIVCHE